MSQNFDFNSQMIFETDKFFNSCHASTIVRASDGTLISAWFAGSDEGKSDVRIWYSVNTDGKWCEPKQIVTPDNAAHWNPVLQSFADRTRIYYKVGPEIEHWVTKYVETFDSGKTWTESKELVDGDRSGGRGPVKNKCLVTHSGTIIAPASHELNSWRAFFDISKDGNIWERTEYVKALDRNGKIVQMIQPTLWENDDGSVHALFRTKSGSIYKSDSSNGGLSWSEAYPTDLPNNNSGIDCARTDDGRIWLVYNPIGLAGNRNKISLAVSDDDGETWNEAACFEDNPDKNAEYSYPAIIADADELHITYTYLRKQIKYINVKLK